MSKNGTTCYFDNSSWAPCQLVLYPGTLFGVVKGNQRNPKLFLGPSILTHSLPASKHSTWRFPAGKITVSNGSAMWEREATAKMAFPTGEVAPVHKANVLKGDLSHKSSARNTLTVGRTNMLKGL